MNRYTLEFFTATGKGTSTFSAVDDDAALLVANDFYASQLKEHGSISHSNLFRHIHFEL